MKFTSATAALAALALVAACDETMTASTDTAGSSTGPATGLPAFAVTCPGGVSINASEHGPVYIDGTEVQLRALSDTYWEATGSGITASISRNPDGTASVSYSGEGGANGICT